MGLARDYVPAVKYGNKWQVSDMQGVTGQPYIGNVWYVDAVSGLDTNGGTSIGNAFKTLYAAHAAASTNNYDMIIIAPSGTGSGTGTDESAYGAWTFSKSLITVVGDAAPSMISPRARVLWATAGQSTSAALLTISGNGNSFINFQLGTFVDNNILVNITGQRNYFGGVHFAGAGDSSTSGDTAARSLILTGGSENMFESCTIGVDTVARSTTNAQIELLSSATRNQFKNCLILTYASNSGHFFVKANAASSAIDRWVIFDGCGFINPIDSAATTMTDAMAVSASLSGSIVLINTYKIGTTGWADNLTAVRALSVSSNSTYNQGIGFPVNPSA